MSEATNESTMPCIDDRAEPCYWRLPGMRCGRMAGMPCNHADRISERRREEMRNGRV